MCNLCMHAGPFWPVFATQGEVNCFICKNVAICGAVLVAKYCSGYGRTEGGTNPILVLLLPIQSLYLSLQYTSTRGWDRAGLLIPCQIFLKVLRKV